MKREDLFFAGPQPLLSSRSHSPPRPILQMRHISLLELFAKISAPSLLQDPFLHISLHFFGGLDGNIFPEIFGILHVNPLILRSLKTD